MDLHINRKLQGFFPQEQSRKVHVFSPSYKLLKCKITWIIN